MLIAVTTGKGNVTEDGVSVAGDIACYRCKANGCDDLILHRLEKLLPFDLDCLPIALTCGMYMHMNTCSIKHESHYNYI